MITGLFEIFLCLLVLFGIYKLVLEHTALHRVKRFYLLFTLLFSLTTPWLNLEIASDKMMIPTGEMISETLYHVVANEQTITQEMITPALLSEVKSKSRTNYAAWAVSGLYFTIALILVIRFVRNIYRLFLKAKRNTRVPYKSFEVVLLKQPTIPHNFLKFIFMHHHDFEKEELREQLLAHELGHAQQRHSLDILLVELLQVLFWFNPMYYFYAKAMRLNHEYLADAMVLGKFNDIPAYQLLLLKFSKHSQSTEMGLACLSNYSLTKKRFKMMTQQTTKATALVRLVILLPLLAATTLCFSLKTKAEAIIGNNANEIISIIENSIFQENKPELHPLGDSNESPTTATFGMREHPISEEQKMHFGIDFMAKTGTPVMAASSGTVEKVETLSGGYGKYIQIKHDSQYQTLYAQLSEIDVQVGETVEKRQVIGKVGSSGMSTMPHLHYEVIKNGERVDPRGYYKRFTPTSTIIRQKSVTDPKVTALYELKKPRGIAFNDGFKYQEVIYGENKALFIKKNQEPIIKEMSELSAEQVDALKSLTLQPPPYMAKTKVMQAIVDNWTDPKQFGIWIDGERIDNSEMKDYQASDFAFHFVSELKKNAKNYGQHRYQLNLTTPEKYEKDKIKSAERYAEWKRTTHELLAKFDF